MLQTQPTIMVYVEELNESFNVKGPFRSETHFLSVSNASPESLIAQIKQAADLLTSIVVNIDDDQPLSDAENYYGPGPRLMIEGYRPLTKSEATLVIARLAEMAENATNFPFGPTTEQCLAARETIAKTHRLAY